MTSSTPEPDRVAWRRPHPAFILVELFGTLRSLAVPFIVVAIGSGTLRDPFSPRSLVTLGIFVAMLLVSLLWNFMEWRFFRYALLPSRLLVRSGWISRQERSVPYQRIQSVDVVATPSYRLLGLARLRVETAGMGETSEVDIRAVSREEAMAVRDHLLREREAARSGAAVPEAARDDARRGEVEGELVRALSMRELLVAGATSGTIGPAAALIGAGLSVADDLVPDAWWQRVPWNRVESLWSSLTIIGLLILAVALLAWLLAIAGTIITYYGFELRHSGEHLFVQHGLLDTRRVTIPVRRIQAVRMDEGILRQPFGYVSLRYISAGRHGEGESGSGTLFPFLRRRDVYALLQGVTPEFAVDVDRTSLATLPPRALPRYIVGGTIMTFLVALAVVGAVLWWRGELPWWAYLPLALVPFRIASGWLGYHDAGWALSERLLVLRSRDLARSTLVTTRRRVQHWSLTANPLQRRARLVTLHVAVAGGGRTSLAQMDKEDGERVLLGTSAITRQ